MTEAAWPPFANEQERTAEECFKCGLKEELPTNVYPGHFLKLKQETWFSLI